MNWRMETEYEKKILISLLLEMFEFTEEMSPQGIDYELNIWESFPWKCIQNNSLISLFNFFFHLK